MPSGMRMGSPSLHSAVAELGEQDGRRGQVLHAALDGVVLVVQAHADDLGLGAPEALLPLGTPVEHGLSSAGAVSGRVRGSGRRRSREQTRSTRLGAAPASRRGQRLGDQLDGVAHALAEAAPAQAVGELHAAAGAAGDDDVGARGGDLRRFAGADLAGEGRVREQERPGAAAADLGRGELHELVTGDAGDELARLAAHALAARQVARVVVGDAQAGRGGGRRQVDALGEELGGVGRAEREGLGARPPVRRRPPGAAG